jgi:hypothetical protein
MSHQLLQALLLGCSKELIGPQMLDDNHGTRLRVGQLCGKGI